MRRLILAPIVIALLWAAHAHAAEFPDHPLISRYPGSLLPRMEVSDFDTYRLIVEPTLERSSVIARDIEGKITYLAYRNPSDRSEHEIYTNYVTALKEAGLEVLFECRGRGGCGQYSGSQWNKFNGMRNIPNDDARYLAGRLATPDGTAFIALNVQRRNTQIVIVETNEMDIGLVRVDAEALGDDLDKYGHVTVPGIFFDHDSDTLTPESEPALAEMTRLLTLRGDLSVWIVGHTDWTGDFDHNMDLSRRRARSVMAVLIRRGISALRLSAAGAGPLAPAAPNTSDDGRAANRRVELVRRP